MQIKNVYGFIFYVVRRYTELNSLGSQISLSYIYLLAALTCTVCFITKGKREDKTTIVANFSLSTLEQASFSYLCTVENIVQEESLG